MKSTLRFLFLLLAWTTLGRTVAWAQLCANPGKDGSPTALAGVVNTYFPGAGTAASGTKSIAVAVASGASGPAIASGDLLLVIQMQGADINSANSSAYGADNASGSGNLTTNFTAGTYEYVVAASALATGAAGTIATTTALANSYSTAAATATTGRRSFQVVRIPQYANVTLGGQVNTLAWDGQIGGILVLDVAGNLNLAGQTLNAAGRGFRGGAGIKYSGYAAGTAGDNTAYRTPSTPDNTTVGANGTKGEGTAGTPRYTAIGTTTRVDNTTLVSAFNGVTDGYANGDNGRGAPGNAGGGATDGGSPTGNEANAGGAGGGNGAAGGQGGAPRSGTDSPVTTNDALGGVAFAATPSRLVMGGGGGAGSNNDGSSDGTGLASSGAAGGGIIMVRTGSLSGTGTATAAGAGGYVLQGVTTVGAVTNDATGGGGAGGTVLVTARTTGGLANLTAVATGGAGSSNTNTSDVPHGPGGGGSGGIVFANGPLATATVTGGAAGTTTYNTGLLTGALSAPATITFGATAGADGVSTTNISTAIANSAAGADCVADVASSISGPATGSAGQPTGTFTATYTNTGAGTAYEVKPSVLLPTGGGLTAAQRATIVAAYPGTTFSTTGAGTNTSTTINFGTLAALASGSPVSYSFVYTAPAAAGTASTTSNISTQTSELGQTANNSNATSTTFGGAADVTVSLAGSTTLNAGQPTGTFTATYTNQGPGTAASVVRLVSLPSGASLTTEQQASIKAAYSGATFPTATSINFGEITGLASDASSTVSFAFTAPTTIGTSALVANTGPGTNGTSEGANLAPNQTTLTLSTIATADVKATIVASATATTGRFDVTFSNIGAQDATGVVRTVQLPKGLAGVTVTGDAGAYDAATGLVTYTTSPTTLAPTSQLTSAITYPLSSSATTIAATATVRTTTNEAGQRANNSATASMPAQFDLATTLTGPLSTIAGSPTMLFVTTTNNGPNEGPTTTQSIQFISIPSAVPLENVYITNGGVYTYNNTDKVGTVSFPSMVSLPNGATITNSISFDAPASTFAPTAVVATITGETNTANNTAYLNGNTAATNLTVLGSTMATANVKTTIQADNTVVDAGALVTYTVTATNAGASGATTVANVVERVQLLPGLSSSVAAPATSTLTVGGRSGTLTGNVIKFATPGDTTSTTYNVKTGLLTYPLVASLTSSSTVTFDQLAVRMPANVGNDGQLLATASVSSAVSDPVPADNTSSVVVKVTTTADLVSTITGPTVITAGQTANYAVTFTNKGLGTAIAVTEKVQLPVGLSNVVVLDVRNNVISNAYNAATGVVTFPAVASDASGISQVYGLSFTAPGQPFIVSSSISSGTTDNTPANNVAVLSTVVNPTADIAIFVSGPATAVAGNSVTYALTASNIGPNAATGVVPTLQLPAGLTGTGTGSPTNPDGSSNNGVVLTNGGTYNASTGLVTFASLDLVSGDSRVGLVTFLMPSTSASSLVASGTYSFAGTSTSVDVVAGNNSAALTTSIAPATPDAADLVTGITPPISPAVAGSSISYVLTFGNNSSTTTAIKVMPVAYLPAGLTGVVIKDAMGVVVSTAFYNANTGQVTFPTIDSQAPNTQVSYTVSLVAPANALVLSASAVSSNTSDPDPTNNSKSHTLTTTAAFDVVTKLAGPSNATPGSVNTYTVTTTNNGPSTSPTTANTTQTVKVPAGSVVSNLPATATYNSGSGVIQFADINGQAAGPNGTVTNTFSVTMPASGILPLSATVALADESNPRNNQDTLGTRRVNQAPVAQNVWNILQNARGNTANLRSPKGLPISPLMAKDADGTLNNYTVTLVPATSQGVLYYNTFPVLSGQMIPANATLFFAPTPGYVGDATFSYTATDDNEAVSNVALYTIAVAADQVSKYSVYNTTKGGANAYVVGDILAQVIDANTATYNSAGIIHNATTGELQAGAANGISRATLASSTLPTGVSLDASTGRIYVSGPLEPNTQPQTYTVGVTTVDSNGGASTVSVTFTIGAVPVPLPVTLTTFTAQAVASRDALLNWATASETRNDHFELERSFDGASFVKIGSVAGRGTTSAGSAYTYTDAGVGRQATGLVYYRLRQVDTDGTAHYSPVRTVSFAQVALVSLSLYPNPAHERTSLDLSALAPASSVQAQLLDATGRTLLSWTLAGGQVQPLDVHTLASGAYLLVVTGTQPDGSPLRQALRLTKE